MDNKLQSKVERGQCSFYNNVKLRENVVIHISEFLTQIRNGKWRNETESYRRLVREGKSAEAGRVKNNLPAIMVAGCCEGGHTKANFRTFSGMANVDLDHCEGDLPELMGRLKQQPWVYAAWISVSGKGIKVVVPVMAETQEEYEKMAYPLVTACIGELLNTPVDMQCKDLTRLCYASWDENAFLNENAEVFPWREKLKNAHSIEENPTFPSKAESLVSSPLASSQSTVSSSPKAPEAQGLVAGFYERFCRKHTFVEGHRHDFLLALGRSARRNGMTQEELDLLIRLAERSLVAPDYNAGEIRRNISDSYHFTENNWHSGEGFSGAKGQGGPSAPYFMGNELMSDEDREEEEKEKNKQLRREAPYLPDWIFESLPSQLQSALTVAKHKRQRDMLFLSMLTNLSGCMPNVKLRYDDDYIFPHLFLAVIAPPASGKGIMALPAKLPRLIQKELDEENAKAMREYEQELTLWEQRRIMAMKGKLEGALEPKPEMPMRKTLIVPADVSRSQLIRLMAGSPDGVLLNTSELDTLKAAVNAEYGRFDDLMRACFHHEMFGSDFKTDNRAYLVYAPKMAFSGSGTPNQFYRLCPSVENGAYSRYLIYMAEQDVEFLSMAPRGDKADKAGLFKKLTEETYRMYRYLKAYPTEVSLTPDQWDLHKSYFQGILQSVKMEEADAPISVVLRYGMITARLAMILTAMRKYEAQWSFKDITCTDEDFFISLAIMEVLTTHSLMFATSLRKIKSSPAPMRRYFKVRSALEQLPSTFTYTELIDAFLRAGFGETTAKRYRVRLLNMHIIEKQGDNYVFATPHWRRKLDSSPLGRA